MANNEENTTSVNLKTYNHRISSLFQAYVTHSITKDELIEGLRKIETFHRNTIQDTDPNKSMWFKFNEDDTVVTTIDDLAKDLSNSNREFTMEHLKESLNLEGELFIYYS